MPWQPPALQPYFERIGTTSPTKWTGLELAKSETTTSTVADRPSAETSTVVEPSPTGRIRPSGSTVATRGSRAAYFAEAVRSEGFPSADRPVTATWARLSDPRRTALEGSTSIPDFGASMNPRPRAQSIAKLVETTVSASNSRAGTVRVVTD